jgi:hypothetical protein
MKAARLRLIVAGVLFFAWMGWLAYLALSASLSPHIVLSRPQFLVSNLDVIAQVDRLPEKGVPASVQITEVHWPPEEKKALQGKTIEVKGLGDSGKNWIGPGEYILPLVRSGSNGYVIAAVPHSPGFPPAEYSSQPDQRRMYRIYPVTPDTRAQLDAIPKVNK